MMKKDSIDVEFAIRDGHLDIGIFGPQELITNMEANELLGNIVRKLQGI